MSTLRYESCPKCAIGRFLPPRYEPAKSYMTAGPNAHPERLTYTCSTCGYTKHEPPADADKEPADG